MTNLKSMRVWASVCDVTGFLCHQLSDVSSDEYHKEKGHTYLCDVKVPEVSIDDQHKMIIKSVDSQIAEQQLKMDRLIDKKNQLIAIEHKV